MKRLLTVALICFSILGARPTFAREFDAETGLVHMGARDYDPDSGRFLQEDPVGIGSPISQYDSQRMNLYTYVANNPINRIDPLGLDYLIYQNNKNTLTWVFETNGKETGRKSWPAFSGTPGKFLPIPAGSYYTNTQPSDYVVHSNFHDWGPFSYRLHESFTTRIYNRLVGRAGGFHIHGGLAPGTAGCIEFQDYTRAQASLKEFDSLIRGYGNPLRLNVR